MKFNQVIYKALILLALPMLMVSCADDSVRSSDEQTTSENGKAGSYARFAVVGDYMYVVDNSSLKTYSLTNPELPSKVEEKEIGTRIETIYHMDGKLFIGSGSGLYIYTIEANGVPAQASTFDYNFPIEPCDPVVANDTYAYVTLNTSSPGPCGGTNIVNVLNVFNVADVYNPDLIAQYPMYGPKGVGLDGNTLFLCDDAQGLKIFDTSDPKNLTMIKHIDDITTYDVIPVDGNLLVVGPDNLYQYDYSDLANITKLSEIAVAP